VPELPEAETIVRELRKRAPGHRIVDVAVTRTDILVAPLTPRRLHRALAGRRLDDVERRGKNVILRFEGDLRLVINLGMTGRVVLSDSAGACELSHVAARLELDDGSTLLYDDARRFGRFDLCDADRWQSRNAQLGIEPLSDALDGAAMHTLTRGSTLPIRNWLLDQRRIAGVGNIYAVEALFRAGVRPTRRARTLTRAEATRLAHSLRDVLSESIERRGTTISDYRDPSGEAGTFDRFLRAYGREALPCDQCGAAIKRIVLANRSAFYCPKCQR
jgi:formamidopyrimidine-DNA glycosylase